MEKEEAKIEEKEKARKLIGGVKFDL